MPARFFAFFFAFLFAQTAQAADFAATLDGAPYVVKTALATPDSERPWVWGVMVSNEAFTCEQIKSGAVNRKVSTKTVNTNGETKTTREVTGPSSDTRFMAMFAGSTPGTPAGLVMGSGKGGVDIKLDQRSIVLESNSRLSISLKGPAFSASGSLPYTLCSPIAERPVIAWTGKPAKFTLTKVSQFDRPDERFEVNVALPEGWKHTVPNKEGYVIDDRWTAPDGLVVLAISLESPPDDFAKEAANSSQQSLDAVAPSGMKQRKNEAMGTGAWVLEYGDEQRRTLVVRRFEPGWAHQLSCIVNADPKGAEAVFDSAIRACAGISVK